MNELVEMDCETLDELLRQEEAFIGQDGKTISLAQVCFLAGAEGTRHIWDTPEEDAAWAYLQEQPEN